MAQCDDGGLDIATLLAIFITVFTQNWPYECLTGLCFMIPFALPFTFVLSFTFAHMKNRCLTILAVHFVYSLIALTAIMWFVDRSTAVPLALRETLGPRSAAETLVVSTRRVSTHHRQHARCHSLRLSQFEIAIRKEPRKY